MPSQIVDQIITAIVLFLAGLLAGWCIKAKFVDSAELKSYKALDSELADKREKINNLSEALESLNREKLLQRQDVHDEINTVVARPAYDADCFDADGLRAANDAIQGHVDHPAQPDARLPAASTH